MYIVSVSLTFSYTFLGAVMVSNQTNICFTCAAVLGLLFDTVVASVIYLLQYQFQCLLSDTFVNWCIFSVALTVLQISFTVNLLLMVIHLFCNIVFGQESEVA
jgi:hypothetical protein